MTSAFNNTKIGPALIPYMKRYICHTVTYYMGTNVNICLQHKMCETGFRLSRLNSCLTFCVLSASLKFRLFCSNQLWTDPRPALISEILAPSLWSGPLFSTAVFTCERDSKWNGHKNKQMSIETNKVTIFTFKKH